MSKSLFKSAHPYFFKCTIIKIIDGDTVDADVDLGWDTHISGKRGRIRLAGIDTPESRTRNKEEKKYGLAAKSFVIDFFEGAEEIILQTKGYGKYRILGDFKVGSKWLCKELLKHHHAVEYEGQNKKLKAAAHLANRKLVKLQ